LKAGVFTEQVNRGRQAKRSTAHMAMGIGLALAIAVLFAFVARAATATAASCPNEAFRDGASSALPDCRAYELVTPPETGGYYPMERTLSAPNQYFGLFAIAPSGNSVVFQTQQGAIPGLSGSGSDDRYEAVREQDGWVTSLDGPTAAQSETPGPGGVSRDHGYSFVKTKQSGLPDGGSLNRKAGVTQAESSTWLLRPDGDFELVGHGQLADDPHACGDYIAPGGAHIVFDTRECSGTGSAGPQLLPDAPASGTQAVYDRTATGLHTVSLLPDGSAPTEDAHFQGVSADGSVVLFRVGTVSAGTLYARVDDAETIEVASPSSSPSGPVTAAGASVDGRYVFFVQAGDVFSVDASTEARTPIVSTGDAQLVNIAADGSRAYFVSKSEIGGKGLSGVPNLYLWTAGTGSIELVATVANSDVTGSPCLACWTRGPAATRMDFVTGPGTETSRTTPDGGVLVFVSHAELTSYENEGHAEIYRYVASTGEMSCVSCNSIGPPSGDADLQTFKPFFPVGPPYAYLDVENLTVDGSTVFFETPEALVPRDTDGVVDVYEWREGVVSLITSGRSPSDNYLYGVTPDGSDVIFATNDTLLPRDHTGGSGSIYDARVDGGFAEPATPACQADACQGQPTRPPSLALPASTSFAGKGNLVEHGSCRAFGHRARKLAHRAKRLRRHARRMATRQEGGSRALSHKGARLRRRAAQLSRHAKRCRHANRRAAK